MNKIHKAVGGIVAQLTEMCRPVGLSPSLPHTIVRENVRNTAKKRKKSRLFGFSKKRKKRKKRRSNNIMSIVMKTTVTTLNQFCCLSHSIKAIIF